MFLSRTDRVFHLSIYLFLILLGFATFYPFWNSVVISFNSGADTSLGGISFWPRAFTLDNYKAVLTDKRLLDGFIVSVSRTVIATLMSLLLTILLAYGMSRRSVAFYKFYMIFFIFTMFFQGGLIPSFMINRSLGLMDNFWVLVIPFLINVYHMIIFRTFFRELPDGIEESAKMDGCSNFGILFRIVIPISGPVIATIALFTAIFHWNDWFTASIYINDQSLKPVQSLLQQILNSNYASELITELTGGNGAAMSSLQQANAITTKSLSMAIMVVTTLPIIVVYPFLQKYFVKGVLLGSMKE
jgi:putative aldouronate transport system permease protein